MPFLNPRELHNPDPIENTANRIVFQESYKLIGLFIFLPCAFMGGAIIQTEIEFFHKVSLPISGMATPFILAALWALKDIFTKIEYSFLPRERRIEVTGFSPFSGRIQKNLEYEKVVVFIKKRFCFEKPLGFYHCLYIDFGAWKLVLDKSKSKDKIDKLKIRFTRTVDIDLKQ